jgi:hypothetical protein
MGAVIFNLWIEGSCSLSSSQRPTASRSTPLLSVGYKNPSAAELKP